MTSCSLTSKTPSVYGVGSANLSEEYFITPTYLRSEIDRLGGSNA